MRGGFQTDLSRRFGALAVGSLAALAVTSFVVSAAAAPGARIGPPAVIVTRGEIAIEDVRALAVALRAEGAFEPLGYGEPPAGFGVPSERKILARAAKLQKDGEARFYALSLKPALEVFTEVARTLGGDRPRGSEAPFARALGFQAATEFLLEDRDAAAATLRRLIGSRVDVELDTGLFAPPVIELLDAVRLELSVAAGSLRISGLPGWVTVYVDGLRRSAGTDGVIPGISEGTHQLWVGAAGIAPWKTTVDVARGRVTDLRFVPEPLSIGVGVPAEDALELAEAAGVDHALLVERGTREGVPHIAVTVVQPLGGMRFAAAPVPEELVALARYLSGGEKTPAVATARGELDDIGPKAHPLRRIGLVGVLLGAGVMGVGVGLGTGALNTASEANGLYDDGSFAEANDARLRSERLADIATVLLVSGGALAVASGVLLVLFPLTKTRGAAGKKGPTVSLLPAPGGAHVRIRF